MSEQVDWKKIVKKMRAGDDQATTLFVELTQDPLYKFCYYLTNNQQLAEDICHDTLIKGITKIDTIKNPEQILAWLKQIARRQFLDFVKSASQSKVHMDIDEMNSGPSELSSGENRNDDQITAMEALQSLDADDRMLVILVDIEGYSFSEASQIAEIPEGTAKSRVFRARKKMLDFIGTEREPNSSTVRKV